MTPRVGNPTWMCPACGRKFRRTNQRHACGTGDRARFLANTPPAVVHLYERLETTVIAWGGVEVVTRDRYALFRATRIFADLTLVRDALRLVIHLAREVRDPRFITVVRGNRGTVAHVMLVTSASDLHAAHPLLREAYDTARREESG